MEKITKKIGLVSIILIILGLVGLLVFSGCRDPLVGVYHNYGYEKELETEVETEQEIIIEQEKEPEQIIEPDIDIEEPDIEEPEPAEIKEPDTEQEPDIDIEEPEVEPEPVNYLQIDKNIDYSDKSFKSSVYFQNNYKSFAVNDVEFNGIWINENGAVFQFINSNNFKYWDGVNDIYGYKNGTLQLTEPTFSGQLKTYYKSTDFNDRYFYSDFNSVIYIFTSFKFNNVDSNINGYSKDLSLGGVRFIKKVRTTEPVFDY